MGSSTLLSGMAAAAAARLERWRQHDFYDVLGVAEELGVRRLGLRNLEDLTGSEGARI